MQCAKQDSNMALLAAFFFALFVVYAHSDPSGFINIDCGLPQNGSYVDELTGLTYVSDSSYITGGVALPVLGYSNFIFQQLATVRSFPVGDKHCYSVVVDEGERYLIKATFAYLNYDSLNVLPTFDLYLDGSLWVTVQIDDVISLFVEEAIHVPNRDTISVCLVNVGNGTPFISALEFRAMYKHIYHYTPAGKSLALFARYNVGSVSGGIIRYPLDPYDRTWSPFNDNAWKNSSTDKQTALGNNYQPPREVMQTSQISPKSSDPIGFIFDNNITTTQFFVYMHFAEIQKLRLDERRIIDIYLNEYTSYRGFEPRYLTPLTVVLTQLTTNLSFQLLLKAGAGSTLPPMINAVEFYFVINNTD